MKYVSINLTISGTVVGFGEKKDKDGNVNAGMLQFMDKTEGKMSLIDVKIVGSNGKACEALNGKEITLTDVIASHFEGKTYYRTETLPKA